jgi:hypothetical protein
MYEFMWRILKSYIKQILKNPAPGSINAKGQLQDLTAENSATTHSRCLWQNSQHQLFSRRWLATVGEPSGYHDIKPVSWVGEAV